MIVTMIYTLDTRYVTVSLASVTRASSDTFYSLCVNGEQGLGSILLLPLSSEEGSEMLVSVWCTHICTCICVTVVLKTYKTMCVAITKYLRTEYFIKKRGSFRSESCNFENIDAYGL